MTRNPLPNAEAFGSERLTGALVDLLTQNGHNLELERGELPAQRQKS